MKMRSQQLAARAGRRSCRREIAYNAALYKAARGLDHPAACHRLSSRICQRREVATAGAIIISSTVTMLSSCGVIPWWRHAGNRHQAHGGGDVSWQKLGLAADEADEKVYETDCGGDQRSEDMAYVRNCVLVDNATNKAA